MEEQASIETQIDAYIVLDAEAKDVKRQMSELKKDIVDYAEENVGDEKSILLNGSDGKLMVSFAESFSIDTNRKEFEDVKQAIKDGEVSDIFEEVVTVNVPPSKLEPVVNALKEAGLEDIVTVTAKWNVVKKDFEKYRKTKFADIDNSELQCKVKDVVDVSVTPRVQVK